MSACYRHRQKRIIAPALFALEHNFRDSQSNTVLPCIIVIIVTITAVIIITTITVIVIVIIYYYYMAQRKTNATERTGIHTLPGLPRASDAVGLALETRPEASQDQAGGKEGKGTNSIFHPFIPVVQLSRHLTNF